MIQLIYNQVMLGPVKICGIILDKIEAVFTHQVNQLPIVALLTSK